MPRPTPFPRRGLAPALLTLACALGAAALPLRAQTLPPAQQYGQVSYVTGGFGQDESEAFKAAMGQYALALTLSSRADGHAAYIADVQVVLRDAQDATVLNVTAQGPFLLARLEPGRYRLFATYLGRTLSRELTVRQGATTRIDLNWPDR